MTTTKHISVLLHESVTALKPKAGGIYVDGTLGNGGHTKQIAKSVFPEKVTVIGFDADSDAVGRATKRLEEIENLDFIPVNSFNDSLSEKLKELEIEEVDGILLDLGISSNQLEESGRGFTFKKDEPLKMTMSKNENGDLFTADALVNNATEEELVTIIRVYGEESFAKRIARAIVKEREKYAIRTTDQLSEIIYKAVPVFYRNKKIHPATKTFQAIRIAVNDELERLQKTLEQSFITLKKGGRLSVISFHSLEDRIVKKFIREKADLDLAERLTKKPIVPSEKEVGENPRSRSAKLRILEKK